MFKPLLRGLEDAIQGPDASVKRVVSVSEELVGTLKSKDQKLNDELTVIYNNCVKGVDEEVIFLEALTRLIPFVKEPDVWKDRYLGICIDSAGLDLRLVDLATKLIQSMMSVDLARQLIGKYLDTTTSLEDTSFEQSEQDRFRRLNIRLIVGEWAKEHIQDFSATACDFLPTNELGMLVLIQAVFGEPWDLQVDSLPLFDAVVKLLDSEKPEVKECALNVVCVLSPLVLNATRTQFESLCAAFIRLTESDTDYMRLGSVLYAVDPKRFLTVSEEKLGSKFEMVLGRLKLHPSLIRDRSVDDAYTAQMIRQYVSENAQPRGVALERLLEDYGHLFSKDEEKENSSDSLQFLQREMMILNNELGFSEYARFSLIREHKKNDTKEIRLVVDLPKVQSLVPLESREQSTNTTQTTPLLQSNQRLRNENQRLMDQVDLLKSQVDDLQAQLAETKKSVDPLQEELSQLRNQAILLQQTKTLLEEKLDAAKWNSTETLAVNDADESEKDQLTKEIELANKQHSQLVAQMTLQHRKEMAEMEAELAALRLEKRQQTNKILKQQKLNFQTKLNEYQRAKEVLEEELREKDDKLLVLGSTQPIKIPQTSIPRPIGGYDSGTNLYKADETATWTKFNDQNNTIHSDSSSQATERPPTSSGLSFSIRRHADSTIDTSSISVKGRGGIQNKSKLKM
ncbi:hypothetical protein OGAPHI_004344 [Ogataea philodendri]|uniref:Uncharacterized protein n=1 Tax=Ogataea philodendri TaxID=1378263 RepID=A0A9P8T5J4_9ASCO|nr:uncharacterized protein OGAPHI_004344 [Ogataea philodendri]KAH3666155.1 hypothetical protein OGAPHI_004344 [Ogataea philodendri]